MKLLDKHRTVRALYDEKATILAELETQQAQLQHSIEHLSADEGIEREIRDRYRVVKEGEEIIVLIDPDAPLEAAAAHALESDTEQQSAPWWRRWFKN